ncbi:MAG TPA: hypothetical protein VFB67_04005 [Candidatus Polarisedimenticolaceae bacterium]|nr:hypothetical protein [Candidatus Polarisedimenticolaceae bacterium]
MSRLLGILALGALGALAACSDQGAVPRDAQHLPTVSPRAEAPPASQAVPAVPEGAGTGDTGMAWTVPAGWVAETPSSPMRRAQYRVPGKAGDGECAVFYFGPGQGGDPMANASRWAGQFTLPDGRPATEAMTTSRLPVGGGEALVVEVAGTYNGGMTMTSAPATPKPGYRLLGAIAPGPDANWFFKLTGPDATVAAQREAFLAMVRSLKHGA